MKVLLVFICLVVSVFGQTKYCCAPGQWESKNTFLMGKVDHGTVSVTMIKYVVGHGHPICTSIVLKGFCSFNGNFMKHIEDYGNESVSVDATNHLVYSESNISISTGTFIHMKVLLDGKNMKQYVIQGGICRAAPLKSLPPNCIPDAAVKLTSTYFGTPTSMLPVDVYQFTLGPNTNFANIAPGCTPVFVASYGSLNNVSAVSEKTYANFTVGIKDRSVFNVPEICKHTPIRGPVTDLHHATIF